MDVPRLEAFLEVARLGSMRAAAQSLHLGQPALSARILTLEEEIGARLFERTRRGVRLTLAGRTLLPHAARTIEAIEAGRVAVSQVEQGDEGELVIAAAPVVNASLVPELLARFRRYHPGVHIYVRTGAPERVMEMVSVGSAQLGLIRDPRRVRDPRLVLTPLYEEQLILVARPEHPFVAEGPIPLARLSDATLIFFDRASNDYELARSMLREAGVDPYGVIEVDSVDTARRLVARGLGVALLPSTTVAPAIEAGELASVELDGARQVPRRVVAVERAETSPWAPMRTIQRLLAEATAFVPGAKAVHPGGQASVPVSPGLPPDPAGRSALEPRTG